MQRRAENTLFLSVPKKIVFVLTGIALFAMDSVSYFLKNYDATR